MGGSEEQLLSVNLVRLSGLSLTGSLDRLELVTQIHTLFLNSNQLTSLQGVEVCSRLRYLDVSFNSLSSLEPCSTLHQLELLDARSNAITEVRSKEGALLLPPSLRMLNLAGNPCSQQPEYRTQALLLLPDLVELDRERNAARAGSSSRSSINSSGSAAGGGEEGTSLSAIAAGVVARSKARQAESSGGQ